MSDMYLELKTRIPVVTNWVQVGTSRLQEAQDATGLSNERLARLIPVSSKTWERWKAKGAIPASSVPAAAKALGIDIKRAAPVSIDLSDVSRTQDDRLEELAEAVDEVLEGQRLIRAMLEELAAPPVRKRSSRAADSKRSRM